MKKKKKIKKKKTYSQNSTQTTKLKTLFDRTYSNLIAFVLSKKVKVFQGFSKSKFLGFLTKVNPNNGNETKSEIFAWDMFKSDVISFLLKCIKVFQWLSKSKFLVLLLT